MITILLCHSPLNFIAVKLLHFWDCFNAFFDLVITKFDCCRCGSRSRNTMSLDHRLSIANASKQYAEHATSCRCHMLLVTIISFSSNSASRAKKKKNFFFCAVQCISFHVQCVHFHESRNDNRVCCSIRVHTKCAMINVLIVFADLLPAEFKMQPTSPVYPFS